MLDELTEGFIPVAVRDDRNGNSVISFNPETRKFLLAVSGKLAGPMSLDELKALKENMVDVIDLKGRFIYLQGYDVYGNLK
jgi:hypothetical protein